MTVHKCEKCEDFFLPALRRKRVPMRVQWFQQDGATPHTTDEVLTFLHRHFNRRVISNRYPDLFNAGLKWPPTSPDLNPCDFFLWGFLKQEVFKQAPRTLTELRLKIEQCAAAIKRETLIRVFDNMCIRTREVVNRRGGHFEHIL